MYIHELFLSFFDLIYFDSYLFSYRSISKIGNSMSLHIKKNFNILLPSKAVRLHHGKFEIKSTSTFTVPANINTLTFKLWGAGGGNATNMGSTGGNGAFAGGDLRVSPLQQLYIVIGNAGTTGPYGGGGGGYTGIFSSATYNSASALVIAGAGGGAAYRAGGASGRPNYGGPWGITAFGNTSPGGGGYYYGQTIGTGDYAYGDGGNSFTSSYVVNGDLRVAYFADSDYSGSFGKTKNGGFVVLKY